MAVTLRFLTGALALCALLAFAIPTEAATARDCSICGTGCYKTYTDQLATCSWRVWCQHGARIERDACLTGCITDQGCNDFEWFPKPGDEVNNDFWSYWLI